MLSIVLSSIRPDLNFIVPPIVLSIRPDINFIVPSIVLSIILLCYLLCLV